MDADTYSNSQSRKHLNFYRQNFEKNLRALFSTVEDDKYFKKKILFTKKNVVMLVFKKYENNFFNRILYF